MNTLDYPSVTGQGFGQGPAFYPQVLAIVLMLLGLFELIHGIRTSRPRAIIVKKPEKGKHLFLPYAILALSIVLIILMKYFGFFISGFIIVFFSVILIRSEKTAWTYIYDVIFTLGILVLIYLVFQIFIGIQLPEGILMS